MFLAASSVINGPSSPLYLQTLSATVSFSSKALEGSTAFITRTARPTPTPEAAAAAMMASHCSFLSQPIFQLSN